MCVRLPDACPCTRGQVDVVGPQPKSQVTIREMARVAANYAVGQAVGAVVHTAEPDWPAPSPPNQAESTPAPVAAGEEADEVERVAEGAAELRLEENEEDGSNDDGDSNGLVLEMNEAGVGGVLV